MDPLMAIITFAFGAIIGAIIISVFREPRPETTPNAQLLAMVERLTREAGVNWRAASDRALARYSDEYELVQLESTTKVALAQAQASQTPTKPGPKPANPFAGATVGADIWDESDADGVEFDVQARV